LNNYTLFTPGPIDIPEDVLQAGAKPLVYHREEKFQQLLSNIADKLKKIIYSNGKVFFFTSSGTGAMEAACCNILSSKDKPIVAVCGKFGERWLELCEMYKIEPIVVKEEYGKSIEPEKIEKILKKINKPTVLFTTLTETSTGALDDIKSFGEISRKYDSFLVVDGVAGIGADFCPQDNWHVDILIGASQKALMAPPGISFMSISDRAFEKTKKSDLSKYYFNLQIYDKFIVKNQMPFTPAITVLYGLERGLDTILKKGLDENFKHHEKIASYVRKRINEIEFELLPESPSNALTVMKMYSGMDSTLIIKEIKEKHHILFANGQGDLRGKIIRIGHMGNYDINKLARALDVLEGVLKH
jgi:aspartate aminotransferase-like enzyme